MPITAIVHTYNAERFLDQVLSCLRDFDEVIVCDMESTDSTLQIAERHGVRILTFPRGEHRIAEVARDFAIRQATHPWVLAVDADELVPVELKDYLYDLIRREDCPNGLYIPRRNYFMHRFMHCHYPDHILRFFRRDLTTWPPYVHTFPIVRGRVVKIPKERIDLSFLHLADDSVSDILRKTDHYTQHELEKKRGKRYGGLAFVWRPFFRFFKAYILKGGFRDGMPGFIRACLEGYYQFIFLSKVVEEEQNRRHQS